MVVEVIADSSSGNLPFVGPTSTPSGIPAGDVAATSDITNVIGGTKRFTSGAADVGCNDRGITFKFLDNDKPKAFAEIFGSVTITRVAITVSSFYIRATSSSSTPWLVRFGIIPHSISTSKPKTINYLHNILLGTPIATMSTIVFSSSPSPGEFPFPPGLQMDLKATEVRFPYPAIAVLVVNPSDNKENIKIADVIVEYDLYGCGTTFGASAWLDDLDHLNLDTPSHSSPFATPVTQKIDLPDSPVAAALSSIALESTDEKDLPDSPVTAAPSSPVVPPEPVSSSSPPQTVYTTASATTQEQWQQWFDILLSAPRWSDVPLAPDGMLPSVFIRDHVIDIVNAYAESLIAFEQLPDRMHFLPLRAESSLRACLEDDFNNFFERVIVDGVEKLKLLQ